MVSDTTLRELGRQLGKHPQTRTMYWRQVRAYGRYRYNNNNRLAIEHANERFWFLGFRPLGRKVKGGTYYFIS